MTFGGAATYLWPGGGITVMADVLDLPARAFGSVPTPALVAPLEFTMTRDEFRALGGHDDAVRAFDDILRSGGEYGSAFRGLAHLVRGGGR